MDKHTAENIGAKFDCNDTSEQNSQLLTHIATSHTP
jgi:hypothetical protein